MDEIAPGLTPMWAIEQRRARLDRPRLAVTGSFNVGKSSVANALAGAQLFTVSAVQPGSGVVVASPDDPVVEGQPPTLTRVRLDPAVPFDLVDAPPLDGLGGMIGHRAVVAASHGVALVIDASQPPTRPELDELAWLQERGLNPVVVVNKIDMYPDWRRVVDETQRLVDEDGRRVEVVAVSAELARLASVEGDAALLADSRIDVLRSLLDERLVSRFGRGSERHRRAGAHRVLDAVAAAADSSPRVSDEWARSEAPRLRRALRDVFTEVAGDLDDALAAKLREIRRGADETIEQVDPASVWPELELWVRHALEQAAIALVEEMSARVDTVVVEVSRAMLGAGGPALVREDTIEVEVDAQTPLRVDLETGRRGLSVAALRSSYGGVLMAGMAGTAMGMAVLNPISLVVGAGLGAKVIADDRSRQLDDRRRAARQAVARFLDDQRPVVRAELRATIRAVDREVSLLLDEGVDAMAALASASVTASADLAARIESIRRQVEES